MRFSIFLFLFFSFFYIQSQQQTIYSFAESPQTLLLNPGAETNFNYHYGIPFLSNFNLEAGATSLNLSDLFLDDGIGFTDKLKGVMNNSDERDYINFNLRNDVLFGGFRLDKKSYISFGFYQEVDFIFYLPKDIIELGLYGNTINRTFAFSQLNFRGSINGVLHAGISKKVNEKFNVGARIKLYSSSANVESTNNSGTFRTFTNSQNSLSQTINNVNTEVRTSGLFNNNDDFLNAPRDLFTNTVFGGNLGVGFDAGFTYHFDSNLEFTASIIDFGFIRYSKQIKNFKAEGDYVFDGIDFQFDPLNPIDYWDQLEDDFDQQVDIDENKNAYTSWRPTRLNASLRYSFGKVRSKVCYSATKKDYHSKAVGLQVHSVMRPLEPVFSITSFFENSFSENLHVKLTHTVNNYSNTIFGAALAFQWRTFNFVGSVDNVTQATNLETANSLAINVGLNFVIK